MLKGQEVHKSGTSTIHRRSGDVKTATTSEHRSLLRLLGRHKIASEEDHPGNRADDVRHTKSVRAAVQEAGQIETAQGD